MHDMEIYFSVLQEQRLQIIEDRLQQTSHTQQSRQITSIRADMKRLESRLGKAVEDSAELRKLLFEMCKFLTLFIEHIGVHVYTLSATKVQSMQGVVSGLYEQMNQQLKTSVSFVTPSGYTPLASSSVDTVTERANDGSIYHVM